jgi:hypothetical protein
MSFITKKHLPRRTFLRGMGVTLALPLLDSMIPAGTPLVRTAALPKSRFCGIYIPHGATMDKWMPATEGSGFAFTETLKPLEKLRDRITVVSNLAHPLAGGKGSDAGADHARSAAVFLSGAHPQKGIVQGGKTLDQVLAEKIGQDTPLPSIEVCIEEVALNCGAGYGCSYYNTISWKNDTLPLPMENSPQVVFERLFGDGTNAAQRLSRKQQDSSILDSVTDKVSRLQSGLDAGDRARLGEYLENVREIERRIQKATQQSANNPDVPEAPVGIPEAFEDHIKLMYDLQVLAYQAEITRISTMMYARYQRCGVSRQRHPRRVPHRVAPLQRAGAHGHLRADQPLSRADARLLPGEAEGHARRRWQPAGSLGGAVRQQHEQRQPARSRSAADPRRRRRVRTDERRSPSRVPGAHADVESDAVGTGQARPTSRVVRRQHRHTGNLIQI